MFFSVILKILFLLFLFVFNCFIFFFFFSSRRRHTRWNCDWSSEVCSSDLEVLERYQHVRAFGIAGDSRAMSPAEMDESLAGIFRSLHSHQPKIVHYKTCSTFDSSPEVGSIGRSEERRVGKECRCRWWPCRG